MIITDTLELPGPHTRTSKPLLRRENSSSTTPEGIEDTALKRKLMAYNSIKRYPSKLSRSHGDVANWGKWRLQLEAELGRNAARGENTIRLLRNHSKNIASLLFTVLTVVATLVTKIDGKYETPRARRSKSWRTYLAQSGMSWRVLREGMRQKFGWRIPKVEFRTITRFTSLYLHLRPT